MFGANHAPMLHLGHYLQMVRLQIGQNEIPHGPRPLGHPSCAFKMFSEPMVRLVQTVHIYCVKISTLCKRSETSFHLSLVN
jgi:hypothetical protein